tara:strand:+ start:336 stop:848 length:513 start_codon:yes stop_codon:yes gene_type:complete
MNKILIVPHPKLRQKSKDIDFITNKEIDLSNKMVEIMKKNNGVGLAANQIGILKKIITINIKNQNDDKDNITILFNPTIKSYSKEKVLMEEGCLSIPKQFIEIERPLSIKIEYQDKDNNTILLEKTGYEARVLQHEVDHLSGKLFLDYLSSLKRNKILKRIEKLKKMNEL